MNLMTHFLESGLWGNGMFEQTGFNVLILAQMKLRKISLRNFS